MSFALVEDPTVTVKCRTPENHKHIQLFKMQNDLTPTSLSTLIPNHFQDVHTYNTRYNNVFPLPRTRTSLYASYFLPSTLKLWNSLPPEIKDLLLELIMIMYLYIIITVQD